MASLAGTVVHFGARRNLADNPAINHRAARVRVRPPPSLVLVGIWLDTALRRKS